MRRFLETTLRALRKTTRVLWRALDATRRTLANLLLLAVVIGVVVVLVRGAPAVASGVALVIAPHGRLVESAANDPFGSLESLATGGGPQGETVLRDVLDAIEAAGTDDRIAVLVLDLHRFQGAGLSKLQEVGAALKAFRAHDKRVVARSDHYDQDAYYLAAHADEIWVHPMGEVVLEGYGQWVMHYRDAIDALGVQWNVFRVGTYKSAVEPYLRNDMSEAAREANLAWLTDHWRAYLDDVAAARSLDRSAVADFAEHYDEAMRTAGGDGAEAARTAGLVDQVAARDQVRARLIDLVGEKDHDFRQVSMRDYLLAARTAEPALSGPEVAVVVARGLIVDGGDESGSMGGDATAARIRKAREDDDVRAVVLRVDSPGGSAFASEIIRRELVLTREQGKKVVVSMSSVAASGGYWISTASDQIWASPTTLTGSIGIFGMLPTFERPLARLGIHTDGVGTTPLSGARPDRPLPEPVATVIQASIENGYHRFLDHVGEAREMDREQVDAIGQGRVWSGEDAHERGLVDRLGGLEDAIAAAAGLAELGDDYRVKWIEPERSFFERLATGFGARLGLEPGPRRSMIGDLLGRLAASLSTLDRLCDPRGVYAYAWLPVD